MLRWITAGESHGPELVAVLEGLPAGIPVTTADVQDALARRRLGYGRGARMKFEQDEVSLSGGVRHGLTMGGPVAITVANTEWPKWQDVMSADPVAPEKLTGARAEALTRPRPGHAETAVAGQGQRQRECRGGRQEPSLSRQGDQRRHREEEEEALR